MPKPKIGPKTIQVKIPAELVDAIKAVTSTPGTWQRPYQRIAESLKKTGAEFVGRVREDDLAKMKEWAKNPGEGSYERWAAEILKANGISPYS